MVKNILFVLPFLPYPLVTGGHQAIFNGIVCVKDDFNIYIAYYCNGSDTQAEREFLKHIPNATLLPMDTSHKPISFKARVWNKIKRIATVEERKCYPPYTNGKYDNWQWSMKPQSARWSKFIYDTCIKYKIDIAQVEMPWIMSFLYAIPEGVQKIFIHHELQFVKHELELKNDPDNLYAQICYEHTKASERDMLNYADKVVTLSPIDKRKLEELGVTTPITSSFAVVNTNTEFDPYISDDRILTFIGPDDNMPNRVGLRWFLDNCWKSLKAQEPSYRLKVIGKWRESNKQAILNDYPEVEFLGFVDSLYDAMKGTVMIVPITIGSGIRMKILEAASMGIPFVSTTVGAEGIPLTDGKDCFLTDDPKTFVDDIKKLHDKDLRLYFINNANLIIRDHYSLAALRHNRLKIYNEHE